jgi:putative SOS response-associated peptidase YedK
MSATVFDSDASLDERRIIIRRDRDDVEMVELSWGLQPREAEGRLSPSCAPKAAAFRVTVA